MDSGVRRLFLLDYGWLAGEIGWFIPNPSLYPEKDEAKVTEWVEIPVTGALIEHDDGIIVVDTGSHPEAEKVWPEALWNVFPMTKFTEENRIENQIKLAGYKPEDVTYVVFTHLHLDHAGQTEPLKDSATMIAHKKELMHALYMTWIGKPGAYFPGDIDALRGADWFTFETNEFELLPGVKLILVGGHTPGSILVSVTTKKGNNYILTGDFVHLQEELEVESKGWLLGDAEEYYTNIRKLKILARRSNTKIIIGHEPRLWEMFPKAPKYLD